jgi:hypothetical protein
MPLTIESRSRRMQVFHLQHDVCCRDRCACAEVAVFVAAENPRTGERARKRTIRRVPGSITFLARERKENLPAAFLELAQVKAAIGRGYLRVVAQAPDGSAPSAAAAASVTPELVASPVPGQPMAVTAPTTAVAPSPAPPSAHVPTPAATNSPPHSDAQALAPQLPGKEA